MRRTFARSLACALAAAAVTVGVASAQGRGSRIWTTANADAHRTSSMPGDVRISKDALAKPGFQLLWKRQLETQSGASSALTQPVFSAPGFITYKGFKGLAFVASLSGAIYSVDYDLNRMFWTRKLEASPSAPATPSCPGGVTFVTEMSLLASRPGGPGRAGPAGGPAPAGGRRSGGPPPRGAVAGLFVVSSDGRLHNVNLQDGSDWFPPAPLLPGANAKVSGSVVVNSVMYVSTADNCGGVPNGVYAMDLTPVQAPTTSPEGLPLVPVATPQSTQVVRWESKGGGVVGVGPALGTDGTVYVATGDGDYSDEAFSDAVVALEEKTLRQKDYFTPGKTPFTASPVVFQYGGRELIAAGNLDGYVYVLDSESLGGADHKTPLARSGRGEGATVRGLSTFEDAEGTRWILAAGSVAQPVDTAFGAVTNGAVVGLKVTGPPNAPAVQTAWISRDLAAPATPAYVNGVVFALATGEPRSAGQPATGAVLYALDASTGKELWNSGTAIASAARAVGPAINDGQVYVVTADGTLYAFGFDIER